VLFGSQGIVVAVLFVVRKSVICVKRLFAVLGGTAILVSCVSFVMFRQVVVPREVTSKVRLSALTSAVAMTFTPHFVADGRVVAAPRRLQLWGRCPITDYHEMTRCPITNNCGARPRDCRCWSMRLAVVVACVADRTPWLCGECVVGGNH
jgi:hypothetical protein